MAKFETGNQAAKGQGRPKGSRNLKKMLKAEETMQAIGFNPVLFLVNLCHNPKTSIDTKAKIAIELSSLLNAKPKPAEGNPGAGADVDPDDDEDSLMEKVERGA